MKTAVLSILLNCALPAGTYTLSIRALGFNSMQVKQDLVAGEQRILPPVRLGIGALGDCFSMPDPERTRFLPAPAFGGLIGTVKNGGKPIVGARVTLACRLASVCHESPRRTSADFDGNFKFENISPGRYDLSVEQDRFFPFNRGFAVTGGLESTYSLNLAPCPNGEDQCVVKLDPSKIKVIVCE